ncbi:hypothetical protein BDZ94DRAFT_1253093 [Collybia nuda]|uniref:Uncharacterized protein n=1 Tax=Collybia nuda TaxID=64659 RepID=A0A9P5YC64_9AGAR|nr:hypothetical protein BDZ94DRAFT_1253093 [Collybia nuda]
MMVAQIILLKSSMYWGWVKICYCCLGDSTFKTARQLVPELLDACEVKTIRAFYRKAWCYTDAYDRGLNARQAEFSVRKYRSHQRIGASVMMSVDILNNPE